jgi:thymidylate kinase
VTSSRPGPRTERRGAVIAFVGSEATGKSTMLAETERGLADGLEVRRVHAGKPPSTPMTAAPNLFLPLLRSLAPGQRSTRVDARHVEHGEDDGLRLPPTLFAIRAVLLAHDRRALLRQAHAAASRGALVLCDRYPSSVTGAPDSPQLARWSGATAGHPVLSWLVRTEARWYADIPPADVVFHLWAPLDVTLQRNRDRDKTEPEELVTLRHRQAGTLRFDGSPVYRIDTTRPLDQSLEDVFEVARKVLAGDARTPGETDRSSSI